MKNIWAYTMPTADTGYTGYISVNKKEDGSIEITLRRHKEPTGWNALLVLSRDQARELGRKLVGLS